MTVGELIVYNSTIPASQGTVLQHLKNIQVTREAVCVVNVDVTSAVCVINVASAVITVDFSSN